MSERRKYLVSRDRRHTVRTAERYLKTQCHEIFDWFFFHKSTAPRPTLKYFRIPFRIRGDIQPQTVEKSTPRYATYTVPKARDDFIVNNEKKKHSSYGMKSFIQ
jgi:hypothetical protein